MRKIATLACAFIVAGSIAQARADVVYDFAFTTSASDVGNLVFTTPDDTVHPTLSAIGGTFDGLNVTGISPYANANNVLYTDRQVPFDFPGISFATTDNTYNLFDDGSPFGQKIGLNTDPNGYPNTGAYAELTSSSLTRRSAAGTDVPEPATWALVGIGLAATVIAARRRNTRSS